MSGKRRLRPEFVAKVISGCVAFARAGGRAGLDERHVLRALRLPGHTATDNGILERDGDLNSCSSVLDDVRARAGATIVIEGVAGIGKSELLTWVCAESAVRGITPLFVRGNQRDQTIAFGGVRTLLGRWVADHDTRRRRALFAGAAAFARIPLGLPHSQPAAPGAMIGLTEALYWLVVNATDATGPDRALLFAVDDAQWLDPESLHWLEFLVERLADLPVVLVLAYRPDEPTPNPALTRIALRADRVIRPQPLSLDAVRTIIGRGLGSRADAPADAFYSMFLRHSGGNPFYLRWMLDLARERGLTPTAASESEVARLTPRQVVIHINERLRGLGPAAQQLARTIAVLGPGSPLDRAIRLSGLDLDDGKREHDRLCKAAILADQPSIDFCHPVIRAAVYDDIDPSQRSDTHLAAARMLHRDNADAGEVAAHLLRTHTAGDPWVADRLCAAAEAAMASGLSGTAARYLERAVQEPPPPDRRWEVRLRHGQALALGEVTNALPELFAAYDLAPDDAVRAEAAVALAKAHGYSNRLGDAVRLLDRAIEGCQDDRLRDQLRAEQLLWAAWWGDDPHRPDRMRHLDRTAPTLAATGHVQRLLITLRAWSLVLRGEPVADATAAIQPVLQGGVTFADLDQGMEVGTMTAFVHLFTDRLTVAESLFHQAVREFDRDGWRGTHLAFARVHQGNVALRQGRPADAVADAEIALRLADRTGAGTPAEQFATGTLIEALLALGDVDRASAVQAERGHGDTRQDALVLPVPQAVRGELELARGETGKAVATLRATGRWLENTYLPNPALCLWRFDLARALRHSAPDEAREIAAIGRQRADRFGGPLARGRALRTLATLHPDDAVDLLEAAADILRDAPNRLEYAHALADLGSALAVRGHNAREPLVTALTLADECGALGLRTAVRHRLAAIGASYDGRQRRANTLDPRRRRVAQLAADGHSDAEIAYSTVLNLHVVTRLLREAHERLGTTSNAELRRALT